ncbi:hypothetical protein KIL84_006606 [Mauremys mutica]|uniref:Uncharacterized protein n=1 Tax=Mauremys mutica TaxID=74926 RepID=A0A9D3X1R7_9SAUR|nr:hypothetical protein KIL84_006606 [Mauremys mutica]
MVDTMSSNTLSNNFIGLVQNLSTFIHISHRSITFKKKIQKDTMTQTEGTSSVSGNECGGSERSRQALHEARWHSHCQALHVINAVFYFSETLLNILQNATTVSVSAKQRGL